MSVGGSDTRRLTIVIDGDSTGGRQAVRATRGEVEQTEQKVGRLRKAFGDLGPTVVAGVAGVGVAAGFQMTIGAASDLNETVSKTKTIFGDSSASVMKWAEDAESSMGMSTRAALDGASVFGNFFSQVGVSAQQTEVMSKRLVELSSDFASFHNAQPAEVMDALAAATRGEYDALQRFVPTANAAAIEAQALADTGKATAKELTLAEKATSLYNVVLKDGGVAIGDFGRTSESAANQQRILMAEIEETGAAIGNVLLPAYQGFLGLVNNVGPLYAAGAAMALVFGRQIQTGAAAGTTAISGWATSVRTASAEARASGGKVSVLKGALNGVQAAAGGAAKGMGGLLSLVGGPWGVGLAAAAVAVGYFTSKAADQEGKNKALTGSLVELATTYGKLGPESAEAVKALVAQNENMQSLVLNAADLELSIKDIVGAINGEEGALDKVNGAYSRHEAELQKLLVTVKDEESWFGKSEDAQRKLTAAGFANQDQLYQAIRAHQAQQTAINSAIGASSKARDATDALSSATDASGTAMHQVAEEARELSDEELTMYEILKDVTSETSNATEKADGLKKAWDSLTKAGQSQEEALLEYHESAQQWSSDMGSLEESVRKARGEIKGKTGADRAAAAQALQTAQQDLASAKALDVRTEAGRNARKAIASVATASRDQMLADIAAGVPAAKALAAHQRRIAAHEREATKAGQSRAQVKKLFELYGKPPDDVALALRVTGQKEATKALEERVIQQAALRKGISVAEARRVHEKNRAGGGPVDGPGTSISDDAGLYRLSKKEWVIQAESSEKYGAAMDDINQGRVPTKLLKNWRQYAEGLAGGGQASWNKRTRDTWPHDISLSNMWVPSKAEAARVAAGGLGTLGGSGMGYQRQMALLRQVFPGLPLYSGFRPGAMTTSGNRSYHASGRAVDIPPRMDVFNWIRSNYGKNTKELIFSPAGGRQVHNGRPHVYSGAVKANHYDHVHWAMDNGGVLPPKSTTTITNATNRREYALTEDKLQGLAGVHIENLNVTIQGDPPTALVRRAVKELRDELVRVSKRNGGKNGL